MLSADDFQMNTASHTKVLLRFYFFKVNERALTVPLESGPSFPHPRVQAGGNETGKARLRSGHGNPLAI
jgi:hypothetical protein